MNEFILVKKYLKPLSFGSLSSLNLNDDVSFDKKKKLVISIDTFVHSVHFLDTEPKKFLKRILRASISDLYCKGVKPESYYLSLSLPKKLVNKTWLSKVKKLLQSEQRKFDITLAGGDTTFSPKFSVTIIVLGYSKKKPILRNTSLENDDIYVTGCISDSFIGLQILQKKKTLINSIIFLNRNIMSQNYLIK